jgi:retron-type reverse transcriptase
MSSGSYFPPPVLAVSIPKKNGAGERILGPGTKQLRQFFDALGEIV